MKFLSVFFLFAASSFALEFAELKGKFFLLTYNNSPYVAAVVELSESGTDYSIKLANVPQSFNPLPEQTITFSKADTKLTVLSDNLLLEDAKGSIEVRNQKDRFEMIRTEGNRKAWDLLATRGGAPGTPINSRDFFKPLEGYYTIELLNGGKPKASIAHYEVDLLTDITEAGVYAPYCAPVSKVCDAGYHGFKYDNAKVFENKLPNGDMFYYILEDEAGQVRYTTYEFQKDRLIARNYQYNFLNKVFFVEHQLKKAEIKK